MLLGLKTAKHVYLMLFFNQVQSRGRGREKETEKQTDTQTEETENLPHGSYRNLTGPSGAVQGSERSLSISS